MSANRPAPAAQRPAGPPMRGPMGAMMGPPQKAKNFKTSGRRLLGLLAPHRGLVIAVLACCTVAVAFTVSGPKILGRATDIIFKGFLGARPVGTNPTDLARAMHVHAGQGIDFGELADVLALAMALYAGAVLFMWLQGYILNHLVQRVVNRLRADVDAKLMRVPLGYFDRQPHGEVLSRVTNDIENVAMGLQQTMSQIVTATITVLGVLVMLVVISPLLAVIAFVTVPLSIVITAKIGKRAQKGFVAQWKHVGALNGQIEEAFTGHALVKVFGRRRQVEERFRAKNDELFEAGFRAQFISSLIMPAITFVGNLNYVAIAVVGGLRVATGAMLLGSVQAFIQYSRQFTQNLSQLAQVANVLQSGVASAERVFELLDEPDQSLDRSAAELPAGRRGRSPVRRRQLSLQTRRASDRAPVAGRAARPDHCDRRADRCGQDHAREPADAVLRSPERRHPDRRHRHRIGAAPGRPRAARHGAAGHLAFRWHDPRQHQVRPSDRDRG